MNSAGSQAAMGPTKVRARHQLATQPSAMPKTPTHFSAATGSMSRAIAAAPSRTYVKFE